MRKLSLIYALIILIIGCDKNNSETPEPTDFGYLSMNLSVRITSEPASARVEVVSTDSWKVTIFKTTDNSEVISFDPFSTAPDEVQLPTGEYYIEAHSNNFQEAAFENPYYFGRSSNFIIDKEELKTIDINAELANSKVAINYSSNVTNTFHSYTGSVRVVSSGIALVYGQGETREGYFVSEPLSVEVNLSYIKLDGNTIDRTFTASINAQPRTLYNINVDAVLADGKIVINLIVNEDFETVDIQLGDDEEAEESRLLPNSQTVLKEDETKLLTWLSSDFHYQANLLFTKILNDGQSSNEFHQTCINIPNTLVIVKTTDGYVFGGYNEGVWKDISGWPGENLINNFLFTINNNMKWILRTDSPYVEKGIINGYWGPTFGGGSAYDLYISAGLEYGYTWKSAYYPENTLPDDIPEGYHSYFTNTDGAELSWTIATMEVWELKTSGVLIN